MQTPKAVQGAVALLAEFGGEWPSFHDSEVLRFSIERTPAVDAAEAAVNLVVHLQRFETRDAGTAAYCQALVNSVVVDFRFGGVKDLSVSGFNHQNVIEEISFSGGEAGAHISVEVFGIYGFEGSWKCKSVEVARLSKGPSDA